MVTAAKEFDKKSDKEILEYILTSGDTTPFSELYDRYANKVYRKCISMVKNKEDAQDLSHDILVKAFLNIASFAGKSSFSTWVYAITYNQCIDFLRQKQKSRIIEYENTHEQKIMDDNEEIERKMIFEIEVTRLKELIHQLSEEDKAILLMKYQDEMSIEDIKNILSLSSSATKMRLKRARDRLRKSYQEKYDVEGNTRVNTKKTSTKKNKTTRMRFLLSLVG